MDTYPTIIASFTTFGPFLRYLRRRARLTQRDLGIAVGYSTAQISLLENGHRLPDLTTLAALFVPALDIEHELELTQRLLQLAAAAQGMKGGSSDARFAHQTPWIAEPIDPAA